MDVVVENAEEAHTEILEARNYQKSTGKWMLWILLVIIVVVLVIVLPIVIPSKSSKNI